MSPTSILLFHLYTTCCFLFSYNVVAESAASVFSFSFDFSNGSIYRSDDLLFEGNASLNGKLVDLTCNTEGESRQGCQGRMSYNHPVPFYDARTREVASFSTRFNFMIKGFNQSIAADGMAFFLSSFPSVLPLDAGGSTLGLHGGDGMNAKGADRIIAVEFDKFRNYFDPSSDHIAIDINTVKASANTTTLPNGSLRGAMTATITFNSTTRMLLATLQFDDNPSLGPVQVSTELPDPVTDLLPSEVAVGFSAATGRYFELHRIISWSFNSTLPFKQQENRKQLIIGGAPVSIIVLVGIFLVWYILSYFRWCRTRDSFSSGTTVKRFEYSDLCDATSRFSKESVLGEGAFGTVYKGRYTDDNGNTQDVAVKKKKKTTVEIEDFLAELRIISETRHMNLVELKGWCCSRNIWDLFDFMCWCRKQKVNLFLVYELVPNGTLEDHLHHREEILPWEKRYQIVKGIGSALRYLHHECNISILHRDIKPGNILLDLDFTAKLADFGLSRTFASKNDTTLVTTAIGTVGYIDPECMKNGDVKFQRKSDVYSFGIVLLEIACRKTREEVLERYRSKAEPSMVEAADEKLNGAFDETQMERVIVLGLKCSDPQGKQRPFMLDAMKFLEDGIELPAITEIQ
ncbi:probable L-type lectin-domain containing receptor kinase S.7 [Lolium rigidum]|uniref:probable L-type lectin-domain containing receptor kinase S.7 n=1 Tax=Lolium rigidum TaxID=89674 RepID=UPI001F5DD3B9|nr:probable L-type lectin-domain containing receptor kinase S.7 [Lolium rigidum]